MNAGSLARQCFWSLTRNKQLAMPMYKAAKLFADCYNDASHDMTCNGEIALLHRLQGAAIGTVFDVGANVGEWASTARHLFPTARTHCFEVYEPTAATLQRKFASDALTTVVASGLSDREGVAELATHANCRQNSIVSVYDKGFTRTEGARVTTGDAYCAANGIEAIDFLKIDVEGAEHLVLSGFKKMLEDQAIRFIQFEYGYANAYTKWLAHDYAEFFDKLGYALGRIASSRIRFDLEWPEDNDFARNPNFLAVRREDMHFLKS
jgi:FkbM family methyltransferase